jgi:hypothetical protein
VTLQQRQRGQNHTQWSDGKVPESNILYTARLVGSAIQMLAPSMTRQVFDPPSLTPLNRPVIFLTSDLFHHG